MNLQQKYHRDDFLEFLKRFLPNFEKDIRPATINSPQVTKEAFFLGQSPDIDLQIFELTHTSSSDARIALAMDGFRMMRDSATYRALVIYRSEKGDDWRLSLMMANPEVDEKGKIIKKLSNPRRYSFLLGPNAKIHTPSAALRDPVKDFSDLKNRFSIEVVNKDFYNQVAMLFTKLAGGKRGEGRAAFNAGKGCLDLVSINDDQIRKEFAVRLVGRLVFCWFLKKKSSKAGRALLSDELLSLSSVKKYKNYYHEILEPLFFQVLNEPVETREKKYCSQPWSDTPFLNGGLFAPHENDYFELGVMGFSKNINTLKISDEWFSELFEVFELYNFTIDENTLADVELSVEPEMLGRIFENLLAEINPETGETARKSTGSYYTPRPIVEYMVDESLKKYLAYKTGLSEQKLVALLAYDYVLEETVLSKAEREAVIKALDSVKIIDPACGSGAFPMGILQKMLLILQKVDPRSDSWLVKQLAKIENGFYKKEFEKKLRSENVNYVHKLGIIQNSIYGVDIQPIAVEISKLRFFLSLIVDENVDDSKNNRGVQHLPNLEFKFVCANSLIGLPKHKRDDELFVVEDHESIEKLKNLRENYINSSGKEKETIKLEFQETQSKMMDFYFMSFRKQGDLFGNEKKLKKQQTAISTQMLGSWEPFSDKSCNWFDPEWMFGIKDGFDIVIANPPYISFYSKQSQARRDTKEYLKILIDRYKFVTNKKKLGRFNTLMFFLEKGIDLNKEGGVLAFIIDTNIHSNPAYDIRKFLTEETQIIEIVDGFQAFEHAASSQMIILCNKNKNASNYNVVWKRISNGVFEEEAKEPVDVILSNKEVSFKAPIGKKENKILSSLAQNQTLADTIGKKFVRTCITFTGKKECFVNPKREKANDYPLVEGASGVKCAYDEIKYSNYVRYDLALRDKLNEIYRQEAISENKRSPKVIGLGNIEMFKAPKLFIRLSDSKLTATFTDQFVCADLSLYVITLPNYKESWNGFLIKYILAVINSRLMTFYFIKNNFIRNLNTGTPQIRLDDLRNLPLKHADNKTQDKLGKLVDQILAIKKKNPQTDTADLEYQIDRIIYMLYGLTENEIKIIESEMNDISSPKSERLSAQSTSSMIDNRKKKGK